MSCLFNFTNQYKKNRALHTIKKGTPKLRTDNKANVFGGKNGKLYENKSTTAITTFMT